MEPHCDEKKIELNDFSRNFPDDPEFKLTIDDHEGDKKNQTPLECLDDDWDIPLERLVMCPNDYRRCGSQGQVYLGRLNHCSVAVKRVRDEALADIKHLKGLEHKNIVQFKGVSRDPRRNYYFIIMEWCSNGTLDQKLHDAYPIISPSNLIDFAQQIASGMEYLHSKNIIHRDLKPSNILFNRHDELKITDFGTHKKFDKSSFSTQSEAGTFQYMAPEVIRGDPYSFPIDVWSYGVVLWEMFCGLRPYSNFEDTRVLWTVGHESCHLPIPTGFPKGLTFIMKGCWEAKQEDRITFKQIIMLLKGASPELKKISRQIWPVTQAGWRREVKDALQRQFNRTYESEEDEVSTQKPKALEDAPEQAQKLRDLHLKLQECCMLLLRDQREIEMQRNMLAKRSQENESRDNELNQLRETLTLVKEECNRRGIKLECLEEQGQSGNDKKRMYLNL